MDEANSNAQKALHQPEPDDDDQKIDASLSLEDEGLSQKIIEKIINSKRGQNQVYDDFLAIVKSFEAVKNSVDAQLRGGSFKLDSSLQSLRDHTRIQKLRNFKFLIISLRTIPPSHRNLSK